MKIGIIGAGNIGSRLAKLFVKSSNEVMISNSRGPQSLTAIANDIGCTVGTVEHAAEFGELIIATIPLKNYESIPNEPLNGKVVIDTINYYPDRDGRFVELDDCKTTTSEIIARHLSKSKLVKAFNAILAKDLETDGKAPGSPKRRALPIAGDDSAAKAIVEKLIDQIGFDIVDSGSLSQSWRFERAKPAYCIPFDKDGLKAALSQAQRTVTVVEGSWRK